MSLFKAREWWSTVVGEEEVFDLGCLCVSNIDNHSSGIDKIIVGSYHGFLRIYNPKPEKTDDGWSGFKADDVMCEMQLSQPVLQVEAGQFVSASSDKHLAVLHPRKLAVYTLVGQSGHVEQGKQYQLKIVYEHNLQRTSFNFCFGSFGGVKGKDFICIQSMDGTVSFFEQESFAFSRFLPGSLLPGPIKYVPKTDSFVTVSSSRQLESYKYQVLAVATDTKTKEESQSLKSGKRVAQDWTLNIGEAAIDIMVTDFPNTESTICVLGERNMYAVTEGGKLKFMKKFEFNPSCFLPYAQVVEGTMNCAVGTHTNTLMVYQDVTLKWAAQLTYVPVQCRVANLSNMRGAIVTLDECGHLQTSYLGTDPSMFTTPTAEVREIDYAELDYEMKELTKVIKEQQHKSALPLPASKSDDDIQITIQIPQGLDNSSMAEDVEFQEDEKVPSITVKVIVKAKSHISNCRLSVHIPPPLACSESLISFPALDPGHPGESLISFYKKYDLMPAELKGEISATYQSTNGAPRVIHHPIKIPLKVVVQPCLPIKNANYKITVDTNKPPVNLNDIFPDLLGENAGGQGNALGFRYFGCPNVITVLASKTSQRYRMQCDQFECMWLLLSELVGRLTGHFGGRKQSDFRISYDGPLPLQEYFEVLDKHFETRMEDEGLDQMLEERATQFRAIQRRLLTRFKDKTPAPLSNLDTLLDGTYRQILALGERKDHNRKLRSQRASELSAATHIINLLIRFWQNLSDSDFAVLEAALTPNVSDNGQQGWEEMVDAAITHLLRTCLAKNAKDQTVNPTPLAMMKDVGKLKKHIALLCDRLSKGARLAIEGQSTPTFTSEGSDSKKSMNSSAAKKTIAPQRKIAETIPDLDDMGMGMDDDDIPEEIDTKPKARYPGKKEKKKKSSAPLGNGALPPLNGELKPAGAAQLPPLGGNSKFMKKPPSEDRSVVPDLDDLGLGDPDQVNGTGSTGEQIYGVDAL